MNILQPRFHGNGFIQVYLGPKTRLHIWSPDFPATRVVNAQIHDHRFVFDSEILVGKLNHKVYTLMPDDEGTHVLHEVYCGGYNRDTHPKQLDGRINLTPELHGIYRPGDWYTFGGPDQFHETWADELTVTIMTKRGEAEPYKAKILAPYGEVPDHAFDPLTQPSVESMCEEVGRVLQHILHESVRAAWEL